MEMNSFFSKNKKKVLTVALAGAFAVTGLAATQYFQPMAAASAMHAQHQGKMMQKQVTNEEMAQNISDMFGIDKQTVLNDLDKGYDIRDVHHAAMISYTANKPFDEVLQAKTMTNNWKSVGEAFGVTQDKLHQSQQILMSKNLAKQLNINEAEVTAYMNDGYRPHDLVIASALAQKSNTDLKTVMTMKTSDNRWKDVAVSLKISDSDFKQCLKDFRGNMKGGFWGGHGMGMMMGGPRGIDIDGQTGPDDEPIEQ